MKKIVFLLALIFFSLQSFAQKGELTVGAQGGYDILYYKNFLYGLNVSYALSDPLQISLSGLMNPKIIRQDELNPNSKMETSLYSLNLDLRFLMLNTKTWAVGPSIGVQYWHGTTKIDNGLPYSDQAPCFNLGIYGKVNLTDYLRLSGGWQYSNISNHKDYERSNLSIFYIGLGWAFDLR